MIFIGGLNGPPDSRFILTVTDTYPKQITVNSDTWQYGADEDILLKNAYRQALGVEASSFWSSKILVTIPSLTHKSQKINFTIQFL